jgi:hypothetical protein
MCVYVNVRVLACVCVCVCVCMCVRMFVYNLVPFLTHRIPIAVSAYIRIYVRVCAFTYGCM